jgi:hypothetical protein
VIVGSLPCIPEIDQVFDVEGIQELDFPIPTPWPSKFVAILSFRNRSIASGTASLFALSRSAAASFSLARSIATERVLVSRDHQTR